jgi:hypothetical protein
MTTNDENVTVCLKMVSSNATSNWKLQNELHKMAFGITILHNMKINDQASCNSVPQNGIIMKRKIEN